MPSEHLGVLAVDPPGVRLVDAGRAGQSPLGQRADGDQTADDGVRILTTLGYCAAQRLVTRAGCLHGVVMVPRQHTRLERANHLGPLADRTYILGGYGTHAGRSRLARVRIGLSVLPMNRDALRLAVLDVA